MSDRTDNSAPTTSTVAVTPRPHGREDVATTDIGDEVILYNPLDGSTHALNVTAAFIWDLCDGTATPDEIADEVIATFGVPPAAAHTDVAALIARLFELELLDAAALSAAKQAGGARHT